MHRSRVARAERVLDKKNYIFSDGNPNAYFIATAYI
jgi:hypothetical protein